MLSERRQFQKILFYSMILFKWHYKKKQNHRTESHLGAGRDHTLESLTTNGQQRAF